jgi:acyl dehydratase
MVDQSAVGREFTPVTARVEPGRLRFFLDTLGENNPLYRDAETATVAGYAAPPVPPTYLFCLEMMDATVPFEFLTALDIDLARVLHGEQRFDFLAPVVVGDTLTFLPRVTGVSEKKGGAMTLVVIGTKVTNQNGVHVADLSRTVVIRNPRPS